MRNKEIKNSIKRIIREMNADVTPGYSRMGMFDRPGPSINTRKTVIPELPVAPMPHMATQLSVEAPNIDDPDFVPAKHDLGLYMTALSQRVPDEETEKFYRTVRKHVEKRYGRERDSRVGASSGMKLESRNIKRIVEAVKKRFLRESMVFGIGGVEHREFFEYLHSEDAEHYLSMDDADNIIDFISKKYKTNDYTFDIEEDTKNLVIYNRGVEQNVVPIAQINQPYGFSESFRRKPLREAYVFGMGGADHREFFEYLRSDDAEEHLSQDDAKDIIDFVVGRYKSRDYTFDIEDETNSLTVYFQGEEQSVIPFEQIQKAAMPAPSAKAALSARAETEKPTFEPGESEFFSNMFLLVQAFSEGTADSLIEVQWDDLEEEYKSARNDLDKPSIQRRMKENVATLQRVKKSVLDFLNLSTTVQRSAEEGAIKEDPNYLLEYKLYHDYRGIDLVEEDVRIGYTAVVKVMSGYDPSTYILLEARDIGILTSPRNWEVLEAELKGVRQPKPQNAQQLKYLADTFKIENVKANPTNRLSKAKAHQYQRQTGQLIGDFVPAAFDLVSKKRAELFPEKVSSTKDTTSGTKKDIDDWMLNQFLPIAFKRKSEGGLGLPSIRMRDIDAMDKIINVLDQNYKLDVNGVTDSIYLDEFADIVNKHYNERINLAKDVVVTQVQELLEKIWKAELKSEFAKSPPAAVTKLYASRLTNIMGHILRNTFILNYPNAQLKNVFPLAEIKNDKFTAERANELNVESGEKLIEKLQQMSTNIFKKYMAQLTEFKFSEPSLADAEKWAADFLNNAEVKEELRQAKIVLLPQTKAKKAKGRPKKDKVEPQPMPTLKSESFNHFDKFMDRILVEDRNRRREVQDEVDLNARMRQRAAREKEHYLHSTRLK